MANSLFLNILKFVSRIVFIKVLSDVYLGVNGLLSNVLGILALAELGIGTAINYSLYKPIAKKNEEKIKSLMLFYKKCYRVIAIVVLILGLGLMPFLSFFIKDTSGIKNLNIIYLIFLANMVIGYLFSYKRTLIIADQKNYKINPFIIFYNFLTTILQIIVLLCFKNYIIYLLVQTLCIILENLTINRYIDKQYPFLKDINNSKKIGKKELTEIKTNIKALMLHKIGTYVLTATDNIVISKYIGIVTVGIYSNYVLIHSAISNFIYMFISNTTASLGNLIAEGDVNKRSKIFNEMNFISFYLYGVTSLCLLFVFNPFIQFVFGIKYLFAFPVVILIVINYYIVGINQVPIIVQSASGTYKYDKFIPLMEAITNLVISIVLVNLIGLPGILIGTLVSYLLPLITKPYVAYKYVLKKPVKTYFIEFFKQLLVLTVSGLIIYFILQFTKKFNLIVQILLSGFISFILPTVVIYIMYKNKEEFIDFKNRVSSLLKKIKKHS